MSTNEIKAFAAGAGANVLTQAQYEALPTVIANGFSAGIAESRQLNKVWRQSSFVSAALAEFVTGAASTDVLDDGDVGALAAKIQAGVDARVAAGSPALSSSAPLMDGVAGAGAAPTAARGDHRHPTDTTRAPLASPAFTGVPTAPNANGVAGNQAQIATVAFYVGQGSDMLPLMNGTADWGSSTRWSRENHVHPTDTTRAPLVSPAFTGVPTAPTATAGTSTTQLATTAFVTAGLDGYGLLAGTQSWTKAQRSPPFYLGAWGGVFTPDFAAANNFFDTMWGNFIMANPSNLVGGQSGAITLTQDAAGGRTLVFGSYWKFPGGAAPSLTTTPGAVDVLVYYVESSTRISARLYNDVK